MKKRQPLVNRVLRKASLLMLAVLLLSGSVLPFVISSRADAAQILNRSLTISSGVPSATNVTYTFSFSIPSTAQVQGLKFIACTNAVGTYPGGTCTPPVGMTAGGDGFSSAAFGTQSGWQGATNFAVDASGANDCVATSNPNILCAKRTDTTAQTIDTPPTARTISFTTVKNPSVANTAFYVGIDTYTTNTWTAPSLSDSGTTASAVVQTLTTYAAVAEVLQFCVGATTVDDATTAVGTDCSVIAGTSVDIGTLDTSTPNISPVNINGGDNNNGIAMLRTNAVNGTSISYIAIQQSGTNHLGTLRISGAVCSAASGPGTGSPPAASGPFTDPCIDAAGGTQNTITGGQEEFGMTIGGVNSSSSTSYTCTYGTPPGNTCSLKPSANYLGAGTSGSSEAYGTSNGFAWVDSGSATQIASAASAVDDEALILKFAATPAITTPFGRYQVQSDYVAVPTY